MSSLLLAAAVVLATPASAQDAPAAHTYTLDAARSDLYVVIRNDTDATLARLGHDHVIYATGWSGTVTWPSEGAAGCAVDISVPVGKLVVDPPGLREKAGLDGNTISEDDKQKLSKNMWSGSQLDSGRFGAITWKATACEPVEGGAKVTGTFTVRGTAVPVTLTMKVTADGATFTASGRFETSHTALGFKPFAASAFGPRNQDRLSFAVRVQGTAR